ncbi:MAG: DUF1214 domain-containing protein [Gammaproteobacteria bacterium]|nr:DUF1214 domain-containing protein [Gammaproteobacteria bacterium]
MSSTLLPWSSYVDLLKPAEDLIELGFDPHSEQLRAQLYQQLLMNLAQGYFIYFQSDADHPDWAPFLNSVFLLQPNPDDTYQLAPVRGDAVYRVVGNRGTIRLLTFSTGANMMGMADAPGKNFGYYDADDLELGADGEFEVIFSAERPAGHEGNWLHLHPESEFIMVRNRGYAWGVEREASLAIERLGAPSLKPRPTPQQVDGRARALLGGFVRRLSRLWLDYQNAVLARGMINQVELADFGGAVPAQAYWQGIFRLAPDQALILEAELPAKHSYWNVQLNDELWNAVEFIYRQSSLNGHQARLDADGRFRAVISLEDPGVANWLDPGGALQGMIIGRWYQADALPLPTLKAVPFKELHQHLPADTPRIDPEQRALQLRERRIGAQLRRRW